MFIYIHSSINTMEPKMSIDVIWDNLDSREKSELVATVASNAVKNGNLVALLRSPYGHYGSIVQAAADHIDALQSKLQTLEALNAPSITSKEA